MVKKSVKIISILMIILLCLGILTNVAQAGFDDIGVDFITENAEDSSGASTSVKGIMQAALVIAQVVGTGIAVIMLIVLAIKYLSAAPWDKADIKKSAVVYIIGAVVLFAASGILGIISNFSKNIR